jgi:hypothetical protein
MSAIWRISWMFGAALARPPHIFNTLSAAKTKNYLIGVFFVNLKSTKKRRCGHQRKCDMGLTKLPNLMGYSNWEKTKKNRACEEFRTAYCRKNKGEYVHSFQTSADHY